jgi:CRISPR-associated protein Cas1
MEQLAASELKTILHSKRANLYYLEHCRLLVNGGRVEYVTDEGKRQLYWNIPIANTTTVLLGTGTSVTQAAMRELAKAGVLVGFCGGGGTPLFSANEIDIEVAWFSPQSEYRPTEYLQHWVRFWFDDALRLLAAKAFQQVRLKRIRQHWTGSKALREVGFEIDADALQTALDASARNVEAAPDNTALLTEEARLTKHLFKLAARATKYGEFTRAKRGSGGDPANGFLDHGNYLAYGLGATATWACRMGSPCCTARHGVVVWCSMWPIW